MELNSVITCPSCRFSRRERVVADACQWFYACTNCGTVLRPRDGDHCVFSSYGAEMHRPFGLVEGVPG